MSAALTLPDPRGGCSCTPTSQNAGDGHVEHLLDYDPACPEHSTHLYDPRRGEWTIRPTDFGPREPTAAEIERGASKYAEHVTGYSMRDGGYTYTCRCGWSETGPDAGSAAQKHRMRAALIAAQAIS